MNSANPHSTAAAPRTTAAPICDCWLEIDLSWFQGGAAAAKVEEFLDRVTPLWHQSEPGYRGVVFCVGWMFDAVLDWNSDPGAPIPTCNGPTYELWTYDRLSALLTDLRGQASERGFPDLRLGLLLHGGRDFSVAIEPNPALRKGRTDRHDDQYGYNIRGAWFAAHPEVWDSRFDHHFWFGSPVAVPADERVWHGDAPPTFGAYFAAKLAAMTKATGFDTVVFRDCILTSNHGSYRGQPTMPPELRHAWTGAIIDTLAAVKRAHPDLLTLGYSGYQSQMLTWRATGFDLWAVAEAGCLDRWITQTWASAFQDYWRTDTLGYTPSLVNTITDQAMIAGTPTRHLFLIETFDAWEPFESLRDFPGKIDWLIQALGHAGVRLSDGTLQRSAGYYISWMNKGATLVSADDVGLLAASTRRLAADLARDPQPAGPCLVFDYPGLRHLLDHPVDHCRGEIFDVWLALLAKFGTGVLSATRAEWLPGVVADGFIYAGPAAPPPGTERLLRQRLEDGVPVLFMGQADSFSPALRRTLDIACEPSPPTAVHAVAAHVEDDWASRIACSDVALNQRRRSLASSPEWQPVLSALGGPVLAKHRTLPCWIWEPPAWAGGQEYTCDNVQSVQTFWLTAMVAGNGWGLPGWQDLARTRPACALTWRYPDRSVALLLGNLENGLCGHSALPVSGILRDDRVWRVEVGQDHVRITPGDEGLQILLAGHQRAILVGRDRGGDAPLR